MTHRLKRAATRALLLCALAALVAAPHRPAPHGARYPDRTRTAAVREDVPSASPRAPMGWSSWNSFASGIDGATIRAQTDALVAAGLPAAGYRYVDIDEGWWQGDRDAAGNITVDPARWPGGMSAVADYIHAKGLRAGIYTDAGRDGCGYHYPTTRPPAPGTGLEGHELQDALQFQRWGFDLVKVDWCGGQAEHLDPRDTYRRIADAVTQATAVTGRPMLLSICEWGTDRPWDWAPGTAALWRTGPDLIHWGERPSADLVLAGFDGNLHPAAQHTGSFNDPDMLIAGMDGLTDAQNRTHLALWAIAGAPLIAGNDLTRMTAATRSTLTNPGMIAIAQDARGLQGVRTAEDTPGLQVYGKVLDGAGRRAVLLLNRTGATAAITARWSGLGLAVGAAAVRDAWSGTTLDSSATGYTASVPAGDSVLLTVDGADAVSRTYEAEAGSRTGGAAVIACAGCSGGAAVIACAGCSGGAAVGGIGDDDDALSLALDGGADGNAENRAGGAERVGLVDIAYVNGDTVARTMTLRLGGPAPTVVSFPPTGSWTAPGTVSVLVPLTGGSAALTLSGTGTPAPDVDTVRLLPLDAAADPADPASDPAPPEPRPRP